MGWWNNHSRCCGDAGLGDAALLYAAVDGVGPDLSARCRSLAHRCAEVIASASIAADVGHCWEQAEHRARPSFVQRQTGYMQGAAGIGSFLVHLASSELGRPIRIPLPDDRL